MKKIIALCLLLSAFGLLAFARPRPCGTRSECFNLLVNTSTLTSTPRPITTSLPPAASQEICNTAYPYPYIAGTCAHATLESVLATWEVNHPSYPATATPPAGYP